MIKSNFFDLENKIVVIAGGTGLIGRELCRGFVECNSTTILTSRNKTNGKKLEKELNDFHKGNVVYCQLDISIEESIDNVIKFVLDKFSRIDVFINCSS